MDMELVLLYLNIRLQLNSFQLQISLEKSNLLTHIDFLVACYFCRVK